MALEHRGSGVYYYTSRRIGRRVVKEYGGSGRPAVLCSQYDALMREKHRLERHRKRWKLDSIRIGISAQRDWLAAIDQVVAEALEKSGWHRVRRQWRRKRGENVSELSNLTELTWVSSELIEAAGQIDPQTEEKASKKDKEALKAVDKFLDNPAAKAFWGDMGRYVLNTWVKHFAGTNEVMRRGLIRFASDLRASLAGPNPNALEQLVAERVVLAWFFANWSEYQYANQVKEFTAAQAQHQFKRLDLAHRNLMSACRTLAKVKRSKLPDVLALVNLAPPAELPKAAPRHI